MKRTVIVLTAALGLVGAASGVASAHETDDWMYSTDAPGAYGYSYYGVASSHVGGVYQQVNAWKVGSYWAFDAFVEDTRTDGYCGTIQVAYTYGAQPSDHWHYRTVPVHDCSTNGTGVSKAYFYGLAEFRSLRSRACHADTSGKIVECESNFHVIG